ncbi:MAG: molybdenum cofactor biosynthesis protein MoaE [Pseudomonadota bacterium]
MRIVVTDARFDPIAEIARFAESANAGALATFVGYCRDEGGAVTRLELQHYEGFTQSEIARLAEPIARRHALVDLLVIHRSGAVAAGEPIVLVAALSPHRASAFKAVEELMDYLKTDAPFWKREVRADGARWIEPTAQDEARRKAIADDHG